MSDQINNVTVGFLGLVVCCTIGFCFWQLRGCAEAELKNIEEKTYRYELLKGVEKK